jgi:hypothetical protein
MTGEALGRYFRICVIQYSVDELAGVPKHQNPFWSVQLGYGIWGDVGSACIR